MEQARINRLPNSWKWDIGKLVILNGEATMDEDGNQWIQRSGSEEQVCLLRVIVVASLESVLSVIVRELDETLIAMNGE